MSNQEWTCGHKAEAVCGECHRLLMVKANELADENMRLRSDARAWDHADRAMAKALTKIARLRMAMEGLLMEWDKFTRYGSPIAKAANERIAAARTELNAPVNDGNDQLE